VLREHLDAATEGEGGEGPNEETPKEAAALPREGATSFRVGDLCPTCGQATFVNTEGCRRCYACGYSEC
jgi:ribonucleoside-diphosphate reductase alpha chain